MRMQASITTQKSGTVVAVLDAEAVLDFLAHDRVVLVVFKEPSVNEKVGDRHVVSCFSGRLSWSTAD